MLPMILNIVDMTGGTTNAPYDPKDDEGGFGDVGRIMQVYFYSIILLNLSFKGAVSENSKHSQPLNTLSDQLRIRYPCLCICKLFIFICGFCAKEIVRINHFSHTHFYYIKVSRVTNVNRGLWVLKILIISQGVPYCKNYEDL